MVEADFNEEILLAAAEILADHVGKQNAITSSELSERLGGFDVDAGNPNTRALIRELVNEHHMPVAACNSGYFVIASEQELTEYLEDLTGRIIGIEQRKQSVLQAVNERGYGGPWGGSGDGGDTDTAPTPGGDQR